AGGGGDGGGGDGGGGEGGGDGGLGVSPSGVTSIGRPGAAMAIFPSGLTRITLTALTSSWRRWGACVRVLCSHQPRRPAASNRTLTYSNVNVNRNNRRDQASSCRLMAVQRSRIGNTASSFSAGSEKTIRSMPISSQKRSCAMSSGTRKMV